VTWHYRFLARCCCWCWGEFAFSARLPPQTEALKWWQHHSPPYWRTAELGSVLLSLARAHWPGALCTVKGGCGTRFALHNSLMFCRFGCARRRGSKWSSPGDTAPPVLLRFRRGSRRKMHCAADCFISH
jgi:hypothetical protein